MRSFCSCVYITSLLQHGCVRFSRTLSVNILRGFHIWKKIIIIVTRLAGLQPSEIMWGAVYGGGAKQLVRVTTSTSSLQGSQSLSTIPDSASSQGPPSPNPSTTMDLAKQRVRLHIKLLQQIGTPASVGGGMSKSLTSRLSLPKKMSIP